jgi:MscS family membrane protein
MSQSILATEWYGNSLEAWLISLAIVAGSIIVSRIFYFLSTHVIKRIFEKAKGKLLYIITDMLEEPIAMIIVIVGFYYAQRKLEFPVTVDASVDKCIFFIVILLITWAISRLLNDLITQYLVPIVEKSESKLDDQLLPIIRKGVCGLVWVLGIIMALDNAGYNVGTIIAGLGIGGLAFAFAAQETIANFFGGLSIFINAPFHIDDRIKIAGVDGWVREVGLMTSKLETLDGRRLTMPNALFSKSVIENVSSEPATRVQQKIGVACDQNVATVERSLAILKRVIAADPDLTDKSAAYFQNFGDSSYDIGLVLWIKKGADYFGTLSRVNLAIIRAFEDEKIAFSLPTRYIVQGK